MKRLKIKCLTPFNSYTLRRFKLYTGDMLVGSISPGQEVEINVGEDITSITVKLDWFKNSVVISKEECSYYLITFDFGHSYASALLQSFNRKSIKILEISEYQFKNPDSVSIGSQPITIGHIDIFSLSIIAIYSIFLILAAYLIYPNHGPASNYSVIISFVHLLNVGLIITDRKNLSIKAYKYRMWGMIGLLSGLIIFLPVGVTFRSCLFFGLVILAARNFDFIKRSEIRKGRRFEIVD